MSQPRSLVVLAAGLGSRYGGLKQLDPLGPGGTTLMDFSVFDAWRAGMERVVFVVRPDLASGFAETLVNRYRSRLEVLSAEQRLDDLPRGQVPPASRSRPWGTTQAVLAAGPKVDGPFAVLNADDFYGREAIETIAGFLGQAEPAPTTHAVAGYRLAATASPAGGVNRARLDLDAEARLLRVTELRDLVRTGDGDFTGSDGGTALSVAADTLVSMNLWGFQPSILPVLTEAFDRFLASKPDDRQESYLPDAVQSGITSGALSVRVLPTTSRWCGVTYAADRGWVGAELRAMVERGEYPEELWP